LGRKAVRHEGGGQNLSAVVFAQAAHQPRRLRCLAWRRGRLRARVPTPHERLWGGVCADADATDNAAPPTRPAAITPRSWRW